MREISLTPEELKRYPDPKFELGLYLLRPECIAEYCEVIKIKDVGYFYQQVVPQTHKGYSGFLVLVSKYKQYGFNSDEEFAIELSNKYGISPEILYEHHLIKVYVREETK